MKLIIKFVLFLIVIVFVSCRKIKESVTPSPIPINNNRAPIADAGIDQTILLPKDSVTLDGTVSSDPDGTSVSYKWIKIAGPISSNIIKTDSSKTVVKNLVMGIYKFELTVTDNGGLFAKDTILIIVNNNKPPVANAGIDISLQFLSCQNRTAITELDGSGSSDPENNIITYNWTVLYGPKGYTITNAALKKTTVENLSQGIYAIQLTVTDAGGYSSKDTVLINLFDTPGTPKEYDIDNTITSTYTFTDNFQPYDKDFYYDITEMYGYGIIPKLGEMNFIVQEFADTASLSDKKDTYIEISSIYINSNVSFPFKIKGISTINLKKAIREGGRSFNGLLTVLDGSAAVCDPNIFKNMPPLNLTGTLDTSTNTITIRFKGKVFF